MSFTNAQLAQQIADLITYWSSFNTEYSNWVGGEVGGGPNTDGEYPLTNWAGEETLLPCPAQLSDDVTGYVAIVDASAVAAAASAAAALASEIQATADAATATAQAALADADRVAAEAAAADALSSQTVATAQAAAAVVSAAAALASEVAAAISEANALASEVAAAASAAAAATFDPALFMKLDGTQAMTGTLTGVGALFSAGITVEGTVTAGGNQTRGVLSALADTLTVPVNDEALSPGRLDLEGRGGYADWRVQPYTGELRIWNSSYAVTDPLLKITTAGILTMRDGFTSTKGNSAFGWGDHGAQGYITAAGALQNVVEDTTPQLGGNLDLNSQEIITTRHGRVGTQSLTSGITLATEWRDLPVGGHHFMNASIGTANGAPVNNYGYFQKVANRDTGPGWGGLWVGYAADQSYVGRSVDGSAFATWEKIITSATPSVANWDTAYGWGDHAGLYLGDTGTQLLAAGVNGRLEITGTGYVINPAGIALGQYTSTIGYLQAPTSGKIVIWNDATTQIAEFNDDLSVNLAGALGVTGAVTGSNLNVANWDTAYGWGNHASGGYAPLAGAALTTATVNGYALSSSASAPPGATQIVKTHTNGYTYLGWINTTSGSTATKPTRIYASTDAFIRYMTAANFKSTLGIANWASLSSGSMTISTSAASGGSNGDIHFKY